MKIISISESTPNQDKVNNEQVDLSELEQKRKAMKTADQKIWLKFQDGSYAAFEYIYI